jgi:hypothetical protein
METATSFDDVKGVVVTKPASALSVSADPTTRKGWTFVWGLKAGPGKVIYRAADGAEQVLADVVIPTPTKGNQARLDVRVAVGQTDAVPVKAVEVGEL